MTSGSNLGKVAVEEVPNTVTKSPLVTVFVVTYNHENYIRKCLDGILSQETDFEYEIILGEDQSTDSTRDICLSYAKDHPDKIRLFLNSRENNISIGGNPTGRFNFIYCAQQSKGEYITICEGDDYWIDPLKLQKQVALLKDNPKASCCFTDVEVVFETDKSDHSYLHMADYPNRIDLDQYLEFYYPIPHVTKMWRSSGQPDYSTKCWQTFIHEVMYFDNALHMYHIISGEAIFLRDKTAAYRVQQNSVTRRAAADNRWHIKEILLSHYYFMDIAPIEYQDKFSAIRMFHFEKLMDHSIANKKVLRLFKDLVWYLTDNRSGSIKSKIKSITKVFRRHFEAKNAS